MLLVVLTLLGTVPVLAQEGGQDGDVDLRDRIDATDQELEDAAARLDAARAELDRITQQVVAATADLTVVDAQLDAARAAQEDAAVASRRASEDLARDGSAVTAQRAARASAEQALTDRVVWLWKHGPGARLDLQIDVAGGAGTGHDLVVGQRVIDEVVESSRTASSAASLHLAQLVAARDVSTRDDARRDAFEANATLADVEVLQRQQAQLTVGLNDLLARQSAIVAGIARDRDVLAALASELRRTLLRVSLDGALVPPADLPLDGPPPPWIDLLPSAGERWATAIDATATKYGVSGSLFTALVWSESGFHATAVSHAGAIGLAQLMPGTAAGLGVDPWDPFQNLAGGARYLQAQIARFGRADLGLAAYNAGPGRVLDAGNNIPNIVETQLYVVRVLERWELLRSAA